MAWYMTFYQGLVQLATTSLLLLIVASAAILAIRQPARRIRVIEWTLAGLLLLPGLALVPAYPRWSILPKFDAPASPAVVLMERMESTEQVDTWPSRAIETSAEPLEEPTEEVLIASVRPRMIVEADVYTEVLAQPTTSSATVPISPEGKWEFALPRDFRFWIVIAYLSGVAGMALWSLVGLVALKRLLRSARPADAACRGLLREIAGPRSDRVSLVVSSRAGQPCAFAWRRVTIVLPRELCNPEDSQKLRWALAHEWSHVERGDVWSWSASGIVRWFYFYQPLVWWLRRHLQLSQDFVADSQAAHSGKLPEDYAEFLTSWSAGYSRPTLAAGLGIGGRISDLKRRVVMLVENHHPLETASPRKWNLAVFPLAILILAAVACVGEQPAGAEPRQAAEPQADATKPVIAEAPQPVQSSEPQTEPAKPAIAGEPVPAQSAKPQAEASKPTAAEAPNPGEPRRVRPHAVPAQVRDPSRPRMIATGDVLIVDVVPNIESPADGQARVLLRPEMKLVVDESGMISLGSRYGSVSVRDLNLNKAQEQIHNLLVSQNAKRTDVTSLSDINVRVMFAEPAVNKAAKALTATGQVQSAAPPASTGPNQPTQSWEKELKQGYVTPQPAAKFKADSQPRLIKPGDSFNIEVEGTPDDHPVKPVINVDADGRVALGAHYGKVNIQGKTLDEAEQAIREFLQKILKDPQVQLTHRDTEPAATGFTGSPNPYTRGPTVSPYVKVLPNLEIDPVPTTQPEVKSWAGPINSGELLVLGAVPRIKPGDILDIEIAGGLLDVPPRMVAVVESSGKVALGVHYGRVEVRGKSLEEAEEAIKKSLSATIKDPQVQVTYWRANDAERVKSEDTSKVKQLEREVSELKSLIQDLKAGKSPSR